MFSAANSGDGATNLWHCENSVRILCERDVDSLVSKFRQGYKGTGFESICVFSKVPLSDVATLLDPGENNLTALPVRS